MKVSIYVGVGQIRYLLNRMGVKKVMYGNAKTTLLRVIPTVTSYFIIVSDILSDIWKFIQLYIDIWYIFSDILFYYGIPFDVLFWLLSGIYSDMLFRHSIRHSFWHLFWHSVSHSILAFSLASILAFYLASIVAFYLASILSFSLTWTLPDLNR